MEMSFRSGVHLEGPSDDGDDAITSSLPRSVEPETVEGGAFIT